MNQCDLLINITSFEILKAVGLDKRRKVYLRKLSKDTGWSYSTVMSKIQDMKDAEIILSHTCGRKIMINLTEKGNKVLQKLNEINEIR